MYRRAYGTVHMGSYEIQDINVGTVNYKCKSLWNASFYTLSPFLLYAPFSLHCIPVHFHPHFLFSSLPVIPPHASSLSSPLHPTQLPLSLFPTLHTILLHSSHFSSLPQQSGPVFHPSFLVDLPSMDTTDCSYSLMQESYGTVNVSLYLFHLYTHVQNVWCAWYKSLMIGVIMSIAPPRI